MFSDYGGTVIAFHIGHDSNVAISIDGRVQCVLELERLFQQRYFYSTSESLKGDWRKALPVLQHFCECESDPRDARRSGSSCPTDFDHGVIVGFGEEHPSPYCEFPMLVEEFFSVRHWHAVDHHEAHALLGFYDSPFRSALIFAQGYGNDGYYNVYVGAGLTVHRVAQLRYSFSIAYDKLASLIPEVHGCPFRCSGGLKSTRANAILSSKPLSSYPSKCDELLREGLMSARHGLSLAGKLMGYAGVGDLRPDVSEMVERYFKMYSMQTVVPYFNWFALRTDVNETLAEDLRRLLCESVQLQRAIAASTQQVFEEQSLSAAREILARVGATWKIEGIVLTGGPALNVLANQLICENLTSGCDVIPSASSDLPQGIHVPAAPSDCGLSVGALWKVIPPLVRQPLQYLGFRLWDLEDLEPQAVRRKARRLSDIGGVEYLADLLSGRAERPRSHAGVWPNHTKPIIAVVRGRQEFGPRALGHRSLVAIPDSDEIRDRMNVLKFREWYRPVAPMIADEALEEVFGRKIASPYMSMAPRVRDETRERFPALAHMDGTARHQSVGKVDEAWLHSLLLAVGKRTGLAALINTSFNSKGKPITNSVSESLRMLDTLPQLDFVLIEDWLFSKSVQ
jgi:carbamoyltransferase